MASRPFHDPGYLSFTKLLHEKSDILTSVGLRKICGAIVYYLGIIPTDHVSVFTNTISTSPNLWTNPAQLKEHCENVHLAIRSAVTARIKAIKKPFEADGAPKGFVRKELDAFLSGAISGIVAQRPAPSVCLALLTGLLQGVNDHKDQDAAEVGLKKLENEVIISCADLLETVQVTPEEESEDWTEEYKIAEALRDSEPKTAVLQQHLAKIGLESLVGLFSDGRFLENLPSKVLTSSADDTQLVEQAATAMSIYIQTLVDSPTFKSMSLISKLMARSIAGLANQKNTRDDAWRLMATMTSRLDRISRNIETHWASNPLAVSENEEKLVTMVPSSSETIKCLWQILKSFLFSTILVFQTILRVITFEKVPKSLKLAPESHPHALVSSITSSFLHLSFVTSKLGGGLTSHGGGFSEQKRVFYTALDVISSDAWEMNLFMKRLAGRLSDLSLPEGHPVREARTSFFLACAEQLMSGLNEGVIEYTVLPVTHSHLFNPNHRETYEAAHSVILSIFASHAKREATVEATGASDEDEESSGIAVAQKLAPFYADCLLQNVGDTKLSSDQLCLAYASLVSSAVTVDQALAQYCINKLLSALQEASSNSTSEGITNTFHLRRTLVSLISALDSNLLHGLLPEVRQQVLRETDPPRRLKLKELAFKQVLEMVSDAQREMAMKWWLDVRDEFTIKEENGEGQVNGEAEDGESTSGTLELRSRL